MPFITITNRDSDISTPTQTNPIIHNTTQIVTHAGSRDSNKDGLEVACIAIVIAIVVVVVVAGLGVQKWLVKRKRAQKVENNYHSSG
jgi:hypothetical protein